MVTAGLASPATAQERKDGEARNRTWYLTKPAEGETATSLWWIELDHGQEASGIKMVCEPGRGSSRELVLTVNVTGDVDPAGVSRAVARKAALSCTFRAGNRDQTQPVLLEYDGLVEAWAPSCRLAADDASNALDIMRAADFRFSVVMHSATKKPAALKGLDRGARDGRDGSAIKDFADSCLRHQPSR